MDSLAMGQRSVKRNRQPGAASRFPASTDTSICTGTELGVAGWQTSGTVMVVGLS
jgi:hypothetical protein